MKTTMSSEHTAYNAIDESKHTDSIVTVDGDPTVLRLLTEECEDVVVNGSIHEFWGKDIEGVEWRVHVRVS
jgi:hypothetical protein